MNIFNRARTWETPSGKTCDLFADALKQPHLLVAGTTGSGKSVFVDGLISTALYRPPVDVPGGAEFILIDPKGTELDDYADLPHTRRYSCEISDFPVAFEYAVALMEKRNAATKAARRKAPALPKSYNGSDVYLVIDEWADIMNTCKKPVLPLVQRLAQRGRSARVHLVLVTQTPLAVVLPSQVRGNFDSRMALRTRDAGQSRLLIGKPGLESLPRHGQGYYMTPEKESLYHIPMIDAAERQRLIAWWMDQQPRGFLRRRA